MIVTKVGFDNRGQKTGLSAKWIAEAVDASLKRLQTDYIDLYLAHKPDADVPLEETLAAFAKLKEQGKIRAIGCSNYSVSQLQEALDTAAKNDLPRYDVLQPEYNLYNRADFEGPLADLCVAQKLVSSIIIASRQGSSPGNIAPRRIPRASPAATGWVNMSTPAALPFWAPWMRLPWKPEPSLPISRWRGYCGRRP